MSDASNRGRRFPAQWAAASALPARNAVTARDPLRPQRLLHQVAQDAARQVAPTGLGMDSSPVRERMVARLRKEGITSMPLLAAFAAVPRHRFVDTALAIQAYEDTSLPIGLGQTISKPSVVARNSNCSNVIGTFGIAADDETETWVPFGRVTTTDLLVSCVDSAFEPSFVMGTVV